MVMSWSHKNLLVNWTKTVCSPYSMGHIQFTLRRLIISGWKNDQNGHWQLDLPRFRQPYLTNLIEH